MEFSLRILKPIALDYYWVQKQIHKVDPEYLVDLEPNQDVRIKHFLGTFDIHFSTNEMGFRATDPIQNSIPQIACIGDSITMGFGVNDEETFCRKLNNYTDISGQKYQSVNLAVDAYGPSAISRKLQKFLPKLNTKVLYYFPSNGDDIDELNFHHRFQSNWKMKMFEYQFNATKYSYLLSSLKIMIEQMFIRFNETFIYPMIRLNNLRLCMFSDMDKEKCQIKSFSDLAMDFYHDFFIPPKKDPNSPPVFFSDECNEPTAPMEIPKTAYKALDEIIEISQKNQIKLVMVLLPIDIESAYCSQKGKKHRFYNYLLTIKPYLLNKGVDIIDMTLTEHTIKMLDGSGRLNPRPYYIIGDGHYTKMGNQWVADELLRKTKEILP
jgi:hypothetical protein